MNDKFLEHVECTAEEITNHFGFECTCNDDVISVYSFIGKYDYKCQMLDRDYMPEFYRFCYCYATKLQKFGIENKNNDLL